ncbi:MAG: polyprenyl synthetase family protein [Planctomycetota bacterium]
MGHQSRGLLHSRWSELSSLIDSELKLRLDQFAKGTPKRLADAVEYSLLAPGKRLRPVLCLMACQTAGGNTQHAIGNACALEMIHCYSLIHDDLPAMDDDDLRRGRPTCHRQFDEATAILAGDALQPMAFESILSASLKPSALVESCQVLAWAAGIRGMVGGQMDDLLEENRSQMQSQIAESIDESPAKRLDSIHRRKTGAMIEASVVLGAIAAGATSECRSALAKYGRGIGIAFQIVDDLLDVESTSEKTGKATGKDAGRGKLTFPGIYGISNSREMASRWVAESLAALEPFTHQAEGLRQIAKYILERHS